MGVLCVEFWGENFFSFYNKALTLKSEQGDALWILSGCKNEIVFFVPK